MDALLPLHDQPDTPHRPGLGITHLDAAVRTVLPNGGTLLDVLRLFVDDGLRGRYRAAVADPAVAEYWDYFDRLGREAERARQVEATVNRLYRLLAPRLIRRIVDTTTTTVPFEAVLAGDRMLLVSLPAGEPTGRRGDFVGALLLAALTDRIFARQAATGEPGRLHLYLDEYARFATPMTAELFTEGRKYGVGLTVAHQTLAQIRDAENRAAERQAGALVCFQLTGPDAEELAGEFDTTPTRTKVSLRQRTVPQYKEWDEEVWDPPEAERAHAEAQDQLARLTETVGKALARRRAGYLHLERRVYRRYGAFAELLAGTLDAREAHQPFNPENFRAGFEGGLRTLGQPDFWHPRFPAALHSYTCEGYRLNLGGYQLPRPRLAGALDADSKYGGDEWYGMSFENHILAEYPELRLLARWDMRKVAAGLKRQLSPLLDTLYKDAIFWFCPYSADHVVFFGSHELDAERRAKLEWLDAWLIQTQPRLGQERSYLCIVPRAIKGKLDIDPLRAWYEVGCWQLTAFPQAIDWLKRWIRDARRDIAALQTEFETQQRQLQEQLTTLKHTHFRVVHHKECLGELPERQDRTVRYPWAGGQRRGPGGWYFEDRIEYLHDQWYDPVEELDQTHADRRLELANQLTQLPPFTVYCRTPAGQRQVALPRTSEVALDEARIEAIRQTSKTRFGRPVEPSPPAPPPTGGGPPPPLSRYHADEPES